MSRHDLHSPEKSTRRVVFRADGDSRTGLGHVVRCLALSSVLEGHFERVFAIVMPSAAIREMILAGCDALMALPDASAFLPRLRPDDIVVLDGYAFGEDLEPAILAEAGRRLVRIDDLAQGPPGAHVLINHNGGVDPAAYGPARHTRLCIGPEYALLRPPFLAVPPESRRGLNPNAWFLSMGGSDPENLTVKFLRLLLGMPETELCHVVVGGANPHWEQIEALAKTAPDRVRLYRNLDAEAMCAAMRRAGSGICPGSSVGMEACAVGMRLFTGWFVDNQRLLAAFLRDRGLAHFLGDLRTVTDHAVIRAIRDAGDGQEMVARQQEVFGGKQKEKLFAIFEPWK